MSLVALRAFKVVHFKDMIVMWIEFIPIVSIGPFGNRTPRTMVLAHNTGFGRRCRLGLGFAVMADAARYAAILMPISRGLFPLDFLSFLTYGRPDNQQGGNGRKTEYFFHHE